MYKHRFGGHGSRELKAESDGVDMWRKHFGFGETMEGQLVILLHAETEDYLVRWTNAPYTFGVRPQNGSSLKIRSYSALAYLRVLVRPRRFLTFEVHIEAWPATMARSDPIGLQGPRQAVIEDYY